MSDRVIRTMRVELTEPEKLVKAQALAKSGFDLAQLESDKSAAVADFTKRIKKVKALQSKLCFDVQTGTEDRDVECRWEHRYRDLCVDLVRCDNNAVVETRHMTPEERQTRMNLVPIRRPRVDDEPEADEPDPETTH